MQELGTLVFWNNEKKFGFIDPDSRKIAKGVFLHVRAFKDLAIEVREGMRLRFDPVTNYSVKHPLKATNVEVVGVQS